MNPIIKIPQPSCIKKAPQVPTPGQNLQTPPSLASKTSTGEWLANFWEEMKKSPSGIYQRNMKLSESIYSSIYNTLNPVDLEQLFQKSPEEQYNILYGFSTIDNKTSSLNRLFSQLYENDDPAYFEKMVTCILAMPEDKKKEILTKLLFVNKRSLSNGSFLVDAVYETNYSSPEVAQVKMKLLISLVDSFDLDTAKRIIKKSEKNVSIYALAGRTRMEKYRETLNQEAIDAADILWSAYSNHIKNSASSNAKRAIQEA